MKKKIQTDGVEELFEIVRAIQAGEEPDEAVQRKRDERAEAERQEALERAEKAREEERKREEARRKEAEEKEEQRRKKNRKKEEAAQMRREARRKVKEESAQNADSPKLRLERDEIPEKNQEPDERLNSNRFREETGFEEDEFEKNLEEDAQKSFDFSALAEWFAGSAQKISGAFGGMAKNSKKRVKPERRQDTADADDSYEEEADETDRPGKGNESDVSGSLSKGDEPGISGRLSKGNESDVSGRLSKGNESDVSDRLSKRNELDVSGSLRERNGADENESGGVGRTYGAQADTGKAVLQSEDEASVPGAEMQPAKSNDEKIIDRILEIDLSDDPVIAEHGEMQKAEDGQENEAADALEPDDSFIREETLVDRADLLKMGEPQSEEAVPEESYEEETKTKKADRKLPDISLKKAAEQIKSLINSLPQRGIRKKELFMIGTGVVLAALVILLVFNGISASLEEKKKMEHVKADKGLTVTVEQEPEKWSTSYPVTLKVRARGAEISSVTIDGENYVPDENGIVVAVTSNNLLELSAQAGEEVLRAQIEIPMLDAQPPVVNVARDEENITVSAADGRSDVAGIWYAAVHKNDFMQLPAYQKYSDPLVFEADTTYYFYAADNAGNSSIPIVTTTEAADSLTLAREEMTLFPDESAYLEIVESPQGALLNNLKFESANPEIVTVDGSGKVQAVSEGSTIVTVSADGVEPVSCTVTVGNERTVTVSAIGDCTLGSDASFNTTTNFDAFAAVNGLDYFFANVKEILENDDATFANFEGTLTTADTREAKEYAFKGDPSYTEVLQSGSVDVVTLANNHSSDYGAQSHTDTKQYLEAAGIDYCTGDEIAIKDVNGVKTAFIGIYVLDEGIAKETQVKETIASAKEQGAQLVIVAFHWGTEKAEQPDATQVSLAHTAVDSGADLVVGHHPHVLQGIENYNGTYIAYSLGNFCFGGNSAPSDTDTVIFRQSFAVSGDGEITGGEVELIPCSISSAQGYNNYQPTPAQGTEAERIISRINEASSAYGQSFTASTGML